MATEDVGIENQTFKDALEGLESAFGKFMEPVAEAINDLAYAVENRDSSARAIELAGNQIVSASEIVATPLARIASHLTSPNETDSNLEPANVVDGLFAIARSLRHIGDAIRDHSIS